MKAIKKLIPFRLWPEDIEKIKAKTIIDRSNFQKVMEIMVKMYLEGDETVMKRIKSVCKTKYAKRSRHNEFSELEIGALYHKIAEVSPLEKINEIFDEIDKDKK